MDVDVILSKVLGLCASLDDAIESGHACDEDAVYALAGMVLELDRWLVEGRRPPVRWRSLRTPPLVLTPGTASNEVLPRRRHGPVRRRHPRADDTQLALPFAVV